MVRVTTLKKKAKPNTVSTDREQCDGSETWGCINESGDR